MVKCIAMFIVLTFLFQGSALAYAKQEAERVALENAKYNVASRPTDEVRVPFTAREVRDAKLFTFPVSKVSLSTMARQFPNAKLEQIYEITESIKTYTRRRKDSCPCPYNLASDNTLCGGRSARARPNVEKPLCYPEDLEQII